jgi:hypothetical protein
LSQDKGSTLVGAGLAAVDSGCTPGPHGVGATGAAVHLRTTDAVVSVASESPKVFSKNTYIVNKQLKC